MADPIVLFDSLSAVAPKLALFVPGAALGIWLTDRLRPTRPSGDRLRSLIERFTRS